MESEKLPPSVRGVIEAESADHGPIVLTAASDLTLQGDQGRQWVVVTKSCLRVLSEKPQPRIEKTVALDQVEQFRAAPVVGSGLLQAWIDGRWVDLVRYTNQRSELFHRFARKLERLRADGRWTADPSEPSDQPRCTRCGLRLSHEGEACARCVHHGAVLRRLGQLLRPQLRPTLIMVVLMLVGVALELVPPKLQQYMVDDVLAVGANNATPGAFTGILLTIVLSLAGTRVLLALVNTAKGRLATFIGASLTRDLRMRLVEKLQMLSVAYYDRHQVGALISRVAYDSEVLQGLVHQMTGGFLLQLVQLVAVGVMLFSLHAKLALLTLIPMPLVLGGSWFFWKRVYPKYYRYWDASSKQASALGGMLSGIRVVKAFAQEDREYANIARSSQYLRQSRLDVDTSTARFSAWMQLIFSLGGLIVWYVGGRHVLADRMSLGSLIAFLAYLAMFYTPLATLSQLTAWLTSTLTACQRIFELLDTPLDVREPSSPVNPPEVRGHVRFDSVTFGYDRHQPVLQDVSFEIHPGEMVGVVGRSGSGKTTLVNLLARFYDTDEGRVLIDGVDVREMGTHDLRRQVGIVLQEPFLFRGTIWDNLIYGDPSATIEEGLRSAKAAGCHDFVIRSALGYDTPLGERGAGLSGGERQRLSLARALLYDPKILVLDEATSSVDTESERAIQEALRVLARGRTTIAIAHRLSTLRDATRILVFDQGRLAEEGSHQQLMALDGLYARLVRLQTQLTTEPSLDGLLHAAEESSAAAASAAPPAQDASPTAATADETAELGLRWLTPGETTFRFGDQDELCMTNATGETFGGIMIVRAFPATLPNGYLSVRIADREGHERELGMVRHLDEWPTADRDTLLRALDRRYFIRTITAIEQLELNQGYLDFSVQTDRGPAEFVMRWAQSQAQDFGRDGKLLTDTEDNRFVIPDLRKLPKRDAELFRRFVYW